jgi:hypothetical protein
MKNGWFQYISIAISALLIVATGCEDEIAKGMAIVRDCTGTYLRQDNNDFKVCNPEKIESYADGQIIQATFSNAKECENSSVDDYICNLYHPFEEVIVIKNVNP